MGVAQHRISQQGSCKYGIGDRLMNDSGERIVRLLFLQPPGVCYIESVINAKVGFERVESLGDES